MGMVDRRMVFVRELLVRQVWVKRWRRMLLIFLAEGTSLVVFLVMKGGNRLRVRVSCCVQIGGIGGRVPSKGSHNARRVKPQVLSHCGHCGGHLPLRRSVHQPGGWCRTWFLLKRKKKGLRFGLCKTLEDFRLILWHQTPVKNFHTKF